MVYLINLYLYCLDFRILSQRIHFKLKYIPYDSGAMKLRQVKSM